MRKKPMRHRDGPTGVAAQWRWPIGAAVGFALVSYFWWPLPESGEIGFLGMLVWMRWLLLAGGACVAAGVAALLKGWGMEPAPPSPDEE